MRTSLRLLATGGTAAAVSLLAFAAHADNPRVLVAETGADTVYDVYEGGDASELTAFATGLGTPIGLCQGPGGDLYVTEANLLVEGKAGEVTIITEGGDFTDAPAFARIDALPLGLWCNEERVVLLTLTPDLTLGSLIDITAGGNLENFDVLGYGPQFMNLTHAPNGRYYAATIAGEVYDVSGAMMGGGGVNYSNSMPFAFGAAFGAISSDEEQLLATDLASADILSLDAGGDVSGNSVAALNSASGRALTHLGGSEFWALTADGSVWPLDVSKKEQDPAHATGLTLDPNVPSQQLVATNCLVDDDCSDGDACTGDEVCDMGTCVEADEPDCDDDDVCTADACDMADGCVHEPIAGCCRDDLECGAGETCTSDNVCAPLGGTGGGDSGGDGDSGGLDTGGGDETGGGDGGEAGAGEDGTSSGCSIGGRGARGWGLVVLGMIGLRRRRG